MAEKHRIRTDQFRFTLLPEESAMLTKNAFELGLSKADYLRKIILYGSIIGQHPVMDKEQGRQLLYEVNRIGNNINQIAYNTNLRKETCNIDYKSIKEDCFEILVLLGALVDMERDEFVEWQASVIQCIRKYQQSIEKEFEEYEQSSISHSANKNERKRQF